MSTENMDAIVRATSLLVKNRYLALATVDLRGPWVTVVSYAAVTPNTLFFTSDRTSRHACAIRSDNRVAGAVYDPNINPHEVDGLQFSGTCSEIDADEVLVESLFHHMSGSLSDSPAGEIAAFMADDDLRVYRVVVGETYVLDQHYWAKFGVDRRERVDVVRVFADIETSR